MKKISMLAVIIVLFSGLAVIAGDFTDHGDGTVTDANTGLMWQQGEAGSMNWEDALTYCEALSLAGYTDWRLPNIEELKSITDDSFYMPAIDTKYFPEAQSLFYWSSTTDASSASDALYVVFSDGLSLSYFKSGPCYVRCVRGGQ